MKAKKESLNTKNAPANTGSDRGVKAKKTAGKRGRQIVPNARSGRCPTGTDPRALPTGKTKSPDPKEGPGLSASCPIRGAP